MTLLNTLKNMFFCFSMGLSCSYSMEPSSKESSNDQLIKSSLIKEECKPEYALIAALRNPDIPNKTAISLNKDSLDHIMNYLFKLGYCPFIKITAQMIPHTSLVNGNFSYADFSEVSKTLEIKNSEANFTGANLPEVKFLGDLRKANFTGANLTGAYIESDSNFSEVNLSEANLTRAQINFDSNFIKVNLTGANLSNAHICGANFSDANFTNVNFTNATLFNGFYTKANFSGANLYKIRIRRIRLNDVNFENANLTEATIGDSRLENTNFENANLTKAKIYVSVLENTNFKNANLKEADIFCQIFEQTFFTNANLTGANIYRAFLNTPRGKYRKGADLPENSVLNQED